jgi:hypothetical protein
MQISSTEEVVRGKTNEENTKQDSKMNLIDKELILANETHVGFLLHVMGSRIVDYNVTTHNMKIRALVRSENHEKMFKFLNL